MRVKSDGMVVTLALALGALTACGEESNPAAGDGGDAGTADMEGGARDGSPEPDAEAGADGGRADTGTSSQGGPVEALDVLLVIDDSGSMAEEQQTLAAELPRMLRILTSGDLQDGQPDADGKVGVQDFPPLTDLRLGVVSTNMGAPVDVLPSGLDALPPSAAACKSPGDDGLLRFSEVCGGESAAGPFLEVGPESDVTTQGANFACISQLGTGGCGQEQQLDAMLKALVSDPSYTFYRASTGHGDGKNARFLREDAGLLVVVLSDEQDCSLPDSNAAVMSFATSGTPQVTDTQTGAPFSLDLATPLNLRCGSFPNALHPVARYVEGLRGLKPDHPERVIFAAIAGIPVALEGQGAETILEAPEMQFRPVDQDDFFNPQNQPVPSCSRDHDADPATPTQDAYPPRRMVELASKLGDSGMVRSICRDDFRVAVDDILERLTQRLF